MFVLFLPIALFICDNLCILMDVRIVFYFNDESNCCFGEISIEFVSSLGGMDTLSVIC